MKNIMRWLLCTLFYSVSASATVHLNMQPIETPSEPNAIPLGTPRADNPATESWFSDRGQRVARNISTATITPFIPTTPSDNKRPAIIILPGGAFSQLSLDNEGWPVAQYFAAQGFAAFVVKYRLNPSAASLEDYQAKVVAEIEKIYSGQAKPDLPTPQNAVDDVLAAMTFVQQNAERWSIDTKKIGYIGFSAGAMASLTAVLQSDEATMPAYLGLIYGPMEAVDVPPHAPALFAALSANDPIFGRQGFGIVEGWQKSESPVELHFFQDGGHGFGMGLPGTATENWLSQFMRWLNVNQFTTEQ